MVDENIAAMKRREHIKSVDSDFLDAMAQYVTSQCVVGCNLHCCCLLLCVLRCVLLLWLTALQLKYCSGEAS